MTEAPPIDTDVRESTRGSVLGLPVLSLVAAVIAVVPAALDWMPFTAWTLAASLWLVGSLMQTAGTRIAHTGGLGKTMGVAMAIFVTRTWGVAAVFLVVGVHVKIGASGDTYIGFGLSNIAAWGLGLYAILYSIDFATRMITAAAAQRGPIDIDELRSRKDAS